MRQTRTRVLELFLVVCSCASAASAKGKPEVWLEVRSPHFLVVSNGNEQQAQRVADQFERIRAVFHMVFPNLRVDPSAPIIVIAARNEKTFEPLLPKAMLAKGAARAAGLFQSGPEKNYVLLQLNASGENPYHVLYHEYTHLLLHQSPVALPPWIDEGLAEFYGNTVIMDKTVELGRPDSGHVQLLRQTTLLPLPTLFAVTHDSPYYNEHNKASLFYAESWALVHMLMSEGFKQGHNLLAEYLDNLQLNMDPQAAAVRAFGDLKELQKQLEVYIRGSGFQFFSAKTQTKTDNQSFAVRELTPAAADAVRGDCMVYDGNYEGARATLAHAIEEDAKNAQAAVSMGFLELRQKHLDEAKKWFTQAIQLDSKSYLAQYYYATLRMQELKGAAWGDDVGASLRQAVEINPQFAPAYNALAQFYTNRGENLDEAHRLALQAVTLEPANVYYYLTAASVLMRMHQADNAVRVCKKALALAKQPGELAAAQSLLASAQQYQEYLEKVKRYNEQVAAGTNEAQAGAPASGGAGQPAGGNPTARPVLRHRGEPPQLQRRDETPAQPTIPFHSDPAQRGERDSLTGTIKYVQCAPPAVMKMTFIAGHQTVELFSENYFEVKYSALNFTPSGELHPCHDLKGFAAEVFFYDLKNRPHAGELISVRLRK
jgi:tetratricopeptide (TPR) repeat protein